MTHIRRKTRSGFTLLEVILALAILAGATAVIGELIRSGLRNAETARDLTRAELVADTIVSEVVAGWRSASATMNAQFEDDPRWLYTVALDSTNQQGVIRLQVTVVRDQPAEQHPVQFSLTRWMVDPGVEEMETLEQSTSSTGQSTGSTTSSSTSGGAK